MDAGTIKEFRKFKSIDKYNTGTNTSFLLPFRFHQVNNEKEVLVNEVGDFLIVPIGTSTRIANRQINDKEEIYADLIANFFISEKPIPDLIDILATRYRTKKSFLDEFTALHIFVVSLRCNHSCHYCQVSRVSENKQDFDISIADLKAGIEHMFRTPSSSITMEFQGGEPLLAFDKVKYGIQYANLLNKVHNKEITFVICTNATVFSDEILEFCAQHNVVISTSLDGPAFLHNANRPKTGTKSYEMVMQGIELAREKLGHDKISVLMTTTTLSLDYPIEIIDNYIENGFSNIFLRPISPYGFALKNIKKNHYQTQRYLDFYKKGLDYIIQLNKNGHFMVEDYTTVVLKKILTPFPVSYVDLQSPAGMINNVVVFNYDGSVYATDESRMLAENQDFTFKLGHVQDSYHSLFYGEKAQYFSKFWSNETLAGCADCGFQAYCGADPVFHYASQGDLEGFRPTSDFCTKNMEIIRHIFDLIDREGNDIIKIFNSWINNTPQN
ncbi:His-Xaa-Ser system radical SAM maturase HxsB [Sphingobacterium anhuiense]|uniref:His-Xaa-Ser system radical SAM maturase HxsB n=1 Tax=Sphingobacterium anhuiense TaxID=493780 RepID=UPI003C30D4C6